ncbi:VOC family protein [Paraburkholderia unamae]|uniref:Catechol 2,3-dioxygenase-like lactoylglutathione lyase family enzyme n=1 Tax=Paraburkholderia unamae TaxID=219649 RepID=A0ABX5KV28_9BURK|nr:VOC family protein [Paraburkholderia unamae]PVX85865.1 catechol 2,3-dioxygenase-like lactoylglutathione lyase family enzyme [Paraburkholderia unamae]
MKLPRIEGIHHIKFAVSDLDRSLAFYEKSLGARRIEKFDHRRPDGVLFAYILEMDGLGTHLELRLSPQQAASEARRDHVTLTVDTHEELKAWEAHFESVGVAHSPVLTGLVGWVLALEDPDQRRIRFYTRETHPMGVGVSSNPYWLGNDHESPNDS